MRKRFYILIMLMLVFAFSYSQDTIQVTPQIKFKSSESHKYFGKGYHGEYGREDIEYSQKKKRIEYCYYLDNERTCYGYDYEIINDSILQISESKFWKKDSVGFVNWTFKKLENEKYLIYRSNNEFYQFGNVSSLIPLKIEGKLTTTLPNKKDTLWFVTYPHESPYSRISVEFYTEHIEDKIYEYFEADSIPVNIGGSSIDSAKIDHIRFCFCEPMAAINTMSCIITKEGRIVNVEQAFGNIDMGCPYTLMELVLEIRNRHNLNPAFKNGLPINVRWFIPVNVKHKSYGDFYNHPAISDSKENRKAYIKSKRKNVR